MWVIVVLTICVTVLVIFALYHLRKIFILENVYIPSESFEFGLGDEHDPIVYKELDDYEQL
jgi:hypothetical protein